MLFEAVRASGELEIEEAAPELIRLLGDEDIEIRDAAIWALGTHLLRRSTFPLALLTLVFWMTALTTAVMAVLAFAFERHLWRWPEPHVAWAIAYNAVGVFGFAHAAWFYLARSLPPVASTISVMLIPVLGVFSGALWLGEQLHWQDFAAMAAIVAAIGAVLWRR